MERDLTRRRLLRVALGSAALAGLDSLMPRAAHAGEIATGTTLKISPNSGYCTEDTDVTFEAEVHKADAPDQPGSGLDMEFQIKQADAPWSAARKIGVAVTKAGTSRSSLAFLTRRTGSELGLTKACPYEFRAVFPRQNAPWGERFLGSASDGVLFYLRGSSCETCPDLPPSQGAWWEELEANWRDSYGLVFDRPFPKHPEDNVLLWTSWYYVARKLGDPDGNKFVEPFATTYKHAQLQPGLFRRHPDSHHGDGNEYTEQDDYIGLVAASRMVDPDTRTLAKEVLHYGREHLWLFGETKYPQNFLGRYVYFPGFVATAVGLSVIDWQFFDPTGALRSALAASLIARAGDSTQPSQPGFHENWYLGWLMAKVVDHNSPILVQGAAGQFLAAFRNRWPGGMAQVLQSYWRDHPDHPLIRGFSSAP
jgi:hypothetical protein